MKNWSSESDLDVKFAVAVELAVADHRGKKTGGDKKKQNRINLKLTSTTVIFVSHQITVKY